MFYFFRCFVPCFLHFVARSTAAAVCLSLSLESNFQYCFYKQQLTRHYMKATNNEIIFHLQGQIFPAYTEVTFPVYTVSELLRAWVEGGKGHQRCILRHCFSLTAEWEFTF